MTAAVLVTVLMVACIALAVLCGFLVWLWRDQRKTVDMLSRTLVKALHGSNPEERRRWLRAVESGDAPELPAADGPDQ